MADEQISSHRSPSRVLRCLILSLLFVIVAPVLWITLALKLRQGGELLSLKDWDTGENRIVRLILHRPLIFTANPIHRFISTLTWSQSIFWKLPWSWIGILTLITAELIAPTLASSLTRKALLSWLPKIPRSDSAFLRNLSLPDHRDDHTPYSSDIPTDPMFRWNASFSDFRQNSDTFRTDFVFENDGSMVYYPFDRWGLKSLAFLHHM